MPAKFTVLSLGWGVQSFTLAAKVALGELPMVDYAIHADTTWEREDTYTFAKQWTPWLLTHGLKVVTVSDPAQVAKVTSENTDIPAFTEGLHGRRGQLRRQCTGRWKIEPQQRFIRKLLKKSGIPKTPGIVEKWLGISLDEWQRAKDSDVKYVKHVFPLLERKMSRQDCIRWLAAHDLPVPPKSSCVFCPYHNRLAWEDMKRRGGSDWQRSVEVDAEIRNKRPPFALFVHPSNRPLKEAFTLPEDLGYQQLGMLSSIDEEKVSCDSGHCFL